MHSPATPAQPFPCGAAMSIPTRSFLRSISNGSPRRALKTDCSRPGAATPNFVLNLPQYAGATILIAGPDFGTGSSREHAVWALENYGFKVVIGSRFGDIFRSNSGKAGLLIAVVEQKIIEELWDFVEEHPAAPITVDLVGRQITAEGFQAEFEIDDYTRWRLLEGLDDIGLTLRHVDHIDEFERNRSTHKPKTLPAKVDSVG